MRFSVKDFPTSLGKSIEVDCWNCHTVRFCNRLSIYKTYSILLFYGKKSLWRHDSHQKIDWKSDELLIFNRLQTLLSNFRLRWPHGTILVESKSNERIWWNIVLSDRTLSHALWMTYRKLYIGVYIFIFHPFN